LAISLQSSGATFSTTTKIIRISHSCLDDQTYPPTKGDFSLDAVRTRIWTAGGFTENTFSVFREEMRTFRDRWVAHRDATVKDIVFPQHRQGDVNML
jgi:hypothetical protein